MPHAPQRRLDGPGDQHAREVPCAAPTAVTPAGALLALQATAGNRAVTAMLVARDETKQARYQAGEALTSVDDVMKQRIANAAYTTPEERDAREARFIDSLKMLIGDAGTVRTVIDSKLPVKARPSQNEIDEAVAELTTLADTTTGPDRSWSGLFAKVTARFGMKDPRTTAASMLLGKADEGLGSAMRAELAQELADEPEGAKFGAKLKDKDRKRFAGALRKLPSMQDLAVMHENKSRVPGAEGAAEDAEWKDGKALIDNAVKMDPTGKNEVGPLPAAHLMYQRVEDADAIIRRMAEDTVIGRMDPPKVHVRAQDNDEFRAYENLGGIHVAANEPTHVVVHETGHWIEDHAPKEHFRDVQRLMHKRHEIAGGGAAGKGEGSDKTEGRYLGKYPATGKYTSSAYKHGSTEVTSMTMEYLANPKRFDTMLDKDPVQAAVILRALAPAAYDAEGDLREFDEYLPS